MLGITAMLYIMNNSFCSFVNRNCLGFMTKALPRQICIFFIVSQILILLILLRMHCNPSKCKHQYLSSIIFTYSHTRSVIYTEALTIAKMRVLIAVVQRKKSHVEYLITYRSGHTNGMAPYHHTICTYDS